MIPNTRNMSLLEKAGVAHEFNNHQTIINFNSDYIHEPSGLPVFPKEIVQICRFVCQNFMKYIATGTFRDSTDYVLHQRLVRMDTIFIWYLNIFDKIEVTQPEHPMQLEGIVLNYKTNDSSEVKQFSLKGYARRGEYICPFLLVKMMSVFFTKSLNALKTFIPDRERWCVIQQGSARYESVLEELKEKFEIFGMISDPNLTPVSLGIQCQIPNGPLKYVEINYV